MARCSSDPVFLRNRKINFLEALPAEMGLNLMRYFQAQELAPLRLVSKSWKTFADDNSVWKKLCSDLGINCFNDSGVGSWREKYVQVVEAWAKGRFRVIPHIKEGCENAAGCHPFFVVTFSDYTAELWNLITVKRVNRYQMKERIEMVAVGMSGIVALKLSCEIVIYNGDGMTVIANKNNLDLFLAVLNKKVFYLENMELFVWEEGVNKTYGKVYYAEEVFGKVFYGKDGWLEGWSDQGRVFRAENGTPIYKVAANKRVVAASSEEAIWCWNYQGVVIGYMRISLPPDWIIHTDLPAVLYILYTRGNQRSPNQRYVKLVDLLSGVSIWRMPLPGSHYNIIGHALFPIPPWFVIFYAPNFGRSPEELWVLDTKARTSLYRFNSLGDILYASPTVVAIRESSGDRLVLHLFY